MALGVDTPEGRYVIVIEPGLLSRLGLELEQRGLKGKTVVVTNTTVAVLYGAALERALPEAAVISIPDGEQHKTLDTVRQLYDQFVDAGLDRSGMVIAFGGGVLGDTAGFAAATYMRGVRLVHMPTTLLSMVDSSVGGKVGVDLPQGKNLVGAFKQPEIVLIDPDVLQTLPGRELRCGMAEVIKHGLIADPELFDRVFKLHQPPNWLDDQTQNPRSYFEALTRLLPRSIQVKINLVEEDPFEHNVRAFLNLGHTFGHAVEQVSGYRWLHGQAVGLGLVAAARLSHRLGLCDAALVERTEAITRAVGLPQHLNGLDAEAIYAAMRTDKKWRNGRSRFVLLEGLGKPTIIENVAQSEVIAVLESLK
jgi:3-dehydroquinate synthase